MGALWRARRCLTRKSREQYVKSVVMPDLLYGSVAFSGCLRQDQRSRLQVQQNRAARAVFGLPPRTSAQPLLARLQLYGIEELHKQKTLIMIWRCSNGRASNALQALLEHPSTRTTRAQRSLGLRVPKSASKAGHDRPTARGSILWNTLPSDVRGITQYHQFKQACLPFCLASSSTHY